MADPKFLNGKIYRLVCNDGHYYIGSTVNKLSYRFNNHKCSSKTSNSRVYTYINAIGWDNVKIELIEDYPCASKESLKEREDFYILELKDDELCLNTNRSVVSKEEKLELMKKYYEENKDTIIYQHKNYITKNKEHNDEYQAEYRAKNAEKRREYSKKYVKENPEWKKTYDKNYYETHKKEILENTKVYVKENRQKITERQRLWAKKKRDETAEQRKEERRKKKEMKKKILETPVVCECGGSYQPYRKSRHEESKKHKDYQNSLTVV